MIYSELHLFFCKIDSEINILICSKRLIDFCYPFHSKYFKCLQINIDLSQNSGLCIMMYYNTAVLRFTCFMCQQCL